jgi:site-specific DNA-methyltransferase (adenine-specific)
MRLIRGKKPAFESPEKDFTLYQGDSFRLLKRIPDDSVDVVFADPPYFLSNGGVTCKSGKMAHVNKGKWDRSMGIEEDFQFQVRWLSECQRVLKPTGSIWVCGTRHIIFAAGFAMQRLGFKLLNDIAWFKRNPPPNLSCRYFTHATETILWARKDEKSRHRFNYKTMKALNGGKQMQSLWNILPPRKAEKAQGKHPTQKPLELLERIVLASTLPGETILDPFAGSCTTGLAAVRHGRKFIGIELSDEFVDLSIRRYGGDKEARFEGILPSADWDSPTASLPV